MFKNLKFGKYDKIKAQMKKEEGSNSEIYPNDFSVERIDFKSFRIYKKMEKLKKTYLNGKKGQENEKIGDNLWGSYQK